MNQNALYIPTVKRVFVPPSMIIRIIVTSKQDGINSVYVYLKLGVI